MFVFGVVHCSIVKQLSTCKYTHPESVAGRKQHSEVRRICFHRPVHVHLIARCTSKTGP